MDPINIALGQNSYDIHVSPGLFADLPDMLSQYVRQNRLLLITDEHVAFHYLEGFTANLQTLGVTLSHHILPSGESAKSWQHLEAITDWMFAQQIERGETVIALGGGVVGDITGFASAIAKRGCRFIQIPTTLLAQVDSSVGGKTAINSRHGKNLVGAFHQPAAVYIDPECLNTLDARQLRAGYAEVVKYGLINDADFFRWCEDHGAALLNGDMDARVKAISHCVRAKADIVAQDEKETANVRALLNLGHTFGHALEAETGFGDALLHGEAVAMGMVMAFQFSAQQGLCPTNSAKKVACHLANVGLPTRLADIGMTASGATLAAHMAHDKKRSGGRIPFILVKDIGKAYVDSTIELDDVAAFLDNFG